MRSRCPVAPARLTGCDSSRPAEWRTIEGRVRNKRRRVDPARRLRPGERGEGGARQVDQMPPIDSVLTGPTESAPARRHRGGRYDLIGLRRCRGRKTSNQVVPGVPRPSCRSVGSPGRRPAVPGSVGRGCDQPLSRSALMTRVRQPANRPGTSSRSGTSSRPASATPWSGTTGPSTPRSRSTSPPRSSRRRTSPLAFIGTFATYALAFFFRPLGGCCWVATPTCGTQAGDAADHHADGRRLARHRDPADVRPGGWLGADPAAARPDRAGHVARVARSPTRRRTSPRSRRRSAAAATRRSSTSPPAPRS